MASTLHFDHIIIAVRDLDAATADYRALGFAAYFGGTHAHKQTHNALISLADGSYLELLAPTDPNHIDETIDLLAHGEGFAGYALLSADLTDEAARLHAAGLAFSGPNAGERTRTDGERVAWRTLNLADEPRSPFLIADETPHLLRVPDDADTIEHANGATGVASLVVAVRDLTRAAERYAAILGQAPQPGTQQAGAQTVEFTLGNCTLTLAAPVADDRALATHLADRSERPYRLRLRTGKAAQIGALPLEQAHGARIELVG